MGAEGSASINEAVSLLHAVAPAALASLRKGFPELVGELSLGSVGGLSAVASAHAPLVPSAAAPAHLPTHDWALPAVRGASSAAADGPRPARHHIRDPGSERAATPS